MEPAVTTSAPHFLGLALCVPAAAAAGGSGGGGASGTLAAAGVHRSSASAAIPLPAADSSPLAARQAGGGAEPISCDESSPSSDPQCQSPMSSSPPGQAALSASPVAASRLLFNSRHSHQVQPSAHAAAQPLLAPPLPARPAPLRHMVALTARGLGAVPGSRVWRNPVLERNLETDYECEAVAVRSIEGDDSPGGVNCLSSLIDELATFQCSEAGSGYAYLALWRAGGPAGGGGATRPGVVSAPVPVGRGLLDDHSPTACMDVDRSPLAAAAAMPDYPWTRVSGRRDPAASAGGGHGGLKIVACIVNLLIVDMEPNLVMTVEKDDVADLDEILMHSGSGSGGDSGGTVCCQLVTLAGPSSMQLLRRELPRLVGLVGGEGGGGAAAAGGAGRSPAAAAASTSSVPGGGMPVLTTAPPSVATAASAAAAAKWDGYSLLASAARRAGARAAPAAVIAFSCTGRGLGIYGAPGQEAALLDEATGGAMPLAGMYCEGEIGPLIRNGYVGWAATSRVASGGGGLLLGPGGRSSLPAALVASPPPAAVAAAAASAVAAPPFDRSCPCASAPALQSFTSVFVALS